MPSFDDQFFEVVLGLPGPKQLGGATIDQLVMLNSNLGVTESLLRLQLSAVQAVRQNCKAQIIDRKLRVGALLL